MANTDLAVRIATILDATGLNKADKSLRKFEKTAMGVGKSLGLALGATAIAAYGKRAVKAFSDDEAAAARLATTVDNLGLSFSKVKVADFIAQTERSSGILDDQLRPAMQALLTTTGSLTKSQELLNNAIQISRASGIDLATVSQDLANGYVGITKGLKKYNTGLTQAELSTKSFSEVLGILLSRSAGAADAYLETTSYKIDVLKVAAANASESIGKGLVDAFAKMSGGTTASDAVKTIENIAKAINTVTSAAGSAIGALAKLYQNIDSTTKKIHDNYPDPLGLRDDNNKMKAGRSSSPAGTWLRVQQQKKAEAAAAKRAKELAALQKKQVAAQKALTAEQKKQAALKKAGSIFDLEQIQIIAALKGKLSDEDRKRVELQLALLTENTTEAQKLTYEIAKAQGLGEQMARMLASLPTAKNPFEAWAAYLDMIAEKVKAIASGNGTAGIPSTNGQGQDFSGFAMPTTPAGTAGSASQFGSSTPWAQAAAQSIYVQVDGKTIASALLDQSLSGNQAYVNRRTGGFE